MKRIVLTLAFLLLGLCSGVYAQGNGAIDGFFKSSYELYREEDAEWGTMPLLPRTHGYTYDYDAEDPESVPVGSGLLLLGAMSVGYLAIRKKD